MNEITAGESLVVAAHPDTAPRRPQPVRLRQGARQTKAEKKAAKRGRVDARIGDTLTIAATRLEVRKLLEKSLAGTLALPWVIDRAGLLSCRLSSLVELRIWSATERCADVSDLGSQARGYESLVLAGGLLCTSFQEVGQNSDGVLLRQPVNSLRLASGFARQVQLRKQRASVHRMGERYTLDAHLPHRIEAQGFAVEILQLGLPMAGQAFAYHRRGEAYGSPLPTPATQDEVVRIVGTVLAGWREAQA